MDGCIFQEHICAATSFSSSQRDPLNSKWLKFSSDKDSKKSDSSADYVDQNAPPKYYENDHTHVFISNAELKEIQKYYQSTNINTRINATADGYAVDEVDQIGNTLASGIDNPAYTDTDLSLIKQLDSGDDKQRDNSSDSQRNHKPFPLPIKSLPSKQNKEIIRMTSFRKIEDQDSDDKPEAEAGKPSNGNVPSSTPTVDKRKRLKPYSSKESFKEMSRTTAKSSLQKQPKIQE